MPLIRKIIGVGNSRAVTLPKTWLEYYEREKGQKITHVCIETHGKTLTVYPFFQN